MGIKPKGPKDMMDAMIKNFPVKTGKTLDEWLKVLTLCEFTGYKERIRWLQNEHGLTWGYALAVVDQAKVNAQGGPKSGNQLVDDQFKGEKAKLRPIYDQLIENIQSIADDIEVLPRRTCITLACGKKFGGIQASTKTRLDIGLRIPDIQHTDVLLRVKNFDPDEMTCQVSLTSPDHITDELLGWVKSAYENRKG